MNTQLALLATIVVGGLVAMQAPLNSVLAQATGSFTAAAINFAVGTAVLVAIVALLGHVVQARGAASVPWYYVVGGGIMGAVYVTTVLVTVRSLGAGGVTAATITGQLTASLVLDRMGVFGLVETPVTPTRALGVVLLLLGTVLIIR